jgi:hypothetical protein
LRALPLGARHELDAEIAEGLLDALGVGGSDALVDRERLL